jgi:heterodisulfide reductase subunit C2
MNHSNIASFGKDKDDDPLAGIRKRVQSCLQCGTCTGSCPNAFAMDLTPRTLWRLVMRGETQQVFASQTFSLCSSCYFCTLRCPRGLPLTEAMSELKVLSVRLAPQMNKNSRVFYACFLDSVQRHGRVREMEFMSLYFLHRLNPIIPLKYAPLGLRLMVKGKVRPEMPSLTTKGKLASLFQKVREIEDRA